MTLHSVLRYAVYFGLILLCLVGLPKARAGSATWNLNPVSGDWSTADNWTPVTIPSGPLDTATFGVSNITDISNPGSAIEGIVFTEGAGPYTISLDSQADESTFSIEGTGITNNSGIEQTFSIPSRATIQFAQGTAGSLTTFLAQPATEPEVSGIFDPGGYLVFSGPDANAGDSTIINEGANPLFEDLPVLGGHTVFQDGTAGNATLIAYGGEFGNGEGGVILFPAGSATGGTCRVELFGYYLPGSLDISGRGQGSGVTIGSLEGNGSVFLGDANLTVGSNNLSTTFSGGISDYDPQTGHRFEGSLTKIGTGTLTLSGTFYDYTGPTVIEGGELIVSGSTVSVVTVDGGGTLGGSGTTGGVTVNADGKVALGLTGTGSFDQLTVAGGFTISGGAAIELDFENGFAPQAGDTFDLVTSTQITGAFDTIAIEGLAPGFQYTLTSDGGNLTLTALSDGVATTTLPAAALLNISTRGNVQSGDGVLIGGFIITGTQPKQVIIRALGPSLVRSNVTGVLNDPILELHEPDGTVVTNDDWVDNSIQDQMTIRFNGLDQAAGSPIFNSESVIIEILNPGPYTAIVSGTGGSTGIALVEVYDIDEPDGKLGNISTRGPVGTDQNVLIGGFILGPETGGAPTIVVRAIGPSLRNQGVVNALENPTLDVRDINGDLVGSNDDWMDGPDAEAISSDGLAPTEDAESAFLIISSPGAYTAIVQGVNGITGIGLVEAYNLQ